MVRYRSWPAVSWNCITKLLAKDPLYITFRNGKGPLSAFISSGLAGTTFIQLYSAVFNCISILSLSVEIFCHLHPTQDLLASSIKVVKGDGSRDNLSCQANGFTGRHMKINRNCHFFFSQGSTFASMNSGHEVVIQFYVSLSSCCIRGSNSLV